MKMLAVTMSVMSLASVMLGCEKVEAEYRKAQIKTKIATYKAKEAIHAIHAKKHMEECVQNLMQIQAAVEQAKMEGVETPGWNDIIGADKFIKTKPTCPAGGTYKLPIKDNDDPICTGGDNSVYPHKLPNS